MEIIIGYISVLGTFFFAISGALKAMNSRFDPFGVLIIAFVTAVGGGTLRDILLTNKEVFWLSQPLYIYFIVAGAIVAMVFRSKLSVLQKTLTFFDAIGLGLFTIAGVQIGLDYNLNSINCIILGTITGAFGGVLRDIFVNEVPVIFRKEIYATISIVGGTLYLILVHFKVPTPYVQLIPILLIIIFRILTVYFKWSLPPFYSQPISED